MAILSLCQKKEGRNFLGWYTGRTANDIQITKNTPIYSHLTLIAKRDKYDVDFLDRYSNLFTTFEVKHGGKIQKPQILPEETNDAYTFREWDFDFDTLIYSDVRIKSIWNLNEEKVITFGCYPQSVVSDDILKNELNSLAGGNISGRVLEYDSNNDGEVEKYLCYETDQQFKAENGDKIEIGINYFKFEPIDWIVLGQDSTSYMVLSHRVLDAQYWNRNGYEYEDPETFETEMIYNNYENSEIREWLNNEFINTAFDQDEQSKIPTIVVDNSLSSTLDTSNKYICTDTKDKIYLLSVKETTTQPFLSNPNECDKNRIANATDYAKAIGVDGLLTDNETYGNCFWWTRSPAYDYSANAYFVYTDGRANTTMFANAGYMGIRPALHINL